MSRRDVIGIAQTGTGKTAAFAVPILVGFEVLHFARQLGELLFQMCGLRSEKLRCRRRPDLLWT
jgi:hypothetical protein